MKSSAGLLQTATVGMLELASNVSIRRKGDIAPVFKYVHNHHSWFLHCISSCTVSVLEVLETLETLT